MEVMADQRLPEVDTHEDEEVEVGLQTRKPRHQHSGAIVHSLTKGDNGNGETSENRAYLDTNGGAIEDLDNHKIVNDDLYDSNDTDKAETAVDSRGETGGRSELIEEEVVEEEVVELEFEKAIPKLHTHTMHCPNCDAQITKVVLRRKIIKQKAPRITEEPHEPVCLDGCLSCLSLFLPSGNGSFKPFPIFGSKPARSADSQPAGNEGEISREAGDCFSIFPSLWKPAKKPPHAEPGLVDPLLPSPTPDIKYDSSKHPIGKGRNDGQDVDETSKHEDPGHVPSHGGYPFGLMTNREQIFDARPLPNTSLPTPEPPFRKGRNDGQNVGETLKPRDPPSTGHAPSRDEYPAGPMKSGESVIDVQPDTSATTLDQPQRPGQDSTSFEILKSIVYGGLMEEIASLSVVASAAAADASTLSIIALAFANLIGGVLVIGHNLWDLRDDCYKFSTPEAIGETRNKYKELLGQVDHFPLHMFFAILSFLVFGIIPPVTYGYTFHETSDNDFTIIVVAVASLICVALLAIFKAYIDKCSRFSGYVKTIAYYLVTAVSVSGVSYVFGNLMMRLIEQLGWFETTSGVSMSLGIPAYPSTSLASY